MGRTQAPPSPPYFQPVSNTVQPPPQDQYHYHEEEVVTEEAPRPDTTLGGTEVPPPPSEPYNDENHPPQQFQPPPPKSEPPPQAYHQNSQPPQQAVQFPSTSRGLPPKPYHESSEQRQPAVQFPPQQNPPMVSPGTPPRSYPPQPQGKPQAYPPQADQQPVQFPPPPTSQAAYHQASQPPPVQQQFPPQQQFQAQSQMGAQMNYAPMPGSPLKPAVQTNGGFAPGFPVQNQQYMFPQIGTEGWKTGLFGCLDDPGNALLTALFPCLTFGQIAEIIDNGQTSCATSGMLYGCILFVIGMPCLISCTYRTKLRSRYGLMESPAPDWVTHCLCEWCALCQEYRELQLRGLDPSIGWQGNMARNQNMQLQQQQQVAMVPPTNQTMMG